MVLYGSCKNLAGRGRPFVNQYANLVVFKVAISVGSNVFAWVTSAFGVHNELLFLQKFVYHVNGSMQITARITT